MKRALEIAQYGEGYVSPNPMVGAVIVINDEIVAEGWHEQYGGNHAEVNALNKIQRDLKSATMYVSLEPCSHYGKTPPCVNRIIESGIKKVIVAMEDPNPLVAGKGIKILKEAGIEVVEHVLEEDARALNEIFVKFITEKTPYVVLKTAMTLDGKIASKNGDSKWITSDESRAYVHTLRHRVKGVMVGIGTVLADDPMLNIRTAIKDPMNPIRIVVDTNARIPIDSNLVMTAKEIPLILVVSDTLETTKIEKLKNEGVQILKVPQNQTGIHMNSLMLELGKLKIDSILLEGGGSLNWSMLNEGLVDRVEAFIAPKIIGGAESKTSVEGQGIPLMKDAINLEIKSHERIGNDLLIKAEVIKS